MPPGVEHASEIAVPPAVLSLITVSMPPGVEHLGAGGPPDPAAGLITVSMPPGVEHAELKAERGKHWA